MKVPIREHILAEMAHFQPKQEPNCSSPSTTDFEIQSPSPSCKAPPLIRKSSKPHESV